jgi:aquaporin Z
LNTSLKKYIAEFFGTMVLVAVSPGSAVISGNEIGIIGVALATGFIVAALIYTLGPVSGCHINPSVSIAMYFSGRIGLKDLAYYLLFQFLGGIAGAGIIMLLLLSSGTDLSSINNLGQNGYSYASSGGYNMFSAIIFEIIATFIFLVIILGSTQDEHLKQFSGVAIGLSLTAILILGMPITGVSMNPARSFGPALLVGIKALSQVWVFLLFPSLSGVVVGLIYRNRYIKSISQKGKV